MKFTILGSSGFIGSHLASHVRKSEIECFTPVKNDDLSSYENLGHVIYCIGLTADFRDKPLETVKAHVCALIDFFEKAKFTSFLYLSSTRIYKSLQKSDERSDILVNPFVPDDIYNISKLMGEAVCLSFPDESIRIARLSNVVGSDVHSKNFISSLIRDACTKKKIILDSHLQSEKDYITIEDVLNILPEISRRGKRRIYNVASGMNITHSQILDIVQQQTACAVEHNQDAAIVKFPIISIDHIQEDFSYSPTNVLTSLPFLIEKFKDTLNERA